MPLTHSRSFAQETVQSRATPSKLARHTPHPLRCIRPPHREQGAYDEGAAVWRS
jgi:hypothetical protein